MATKPPAQSQSAAADPQDAATGAPAAPAAPRLGDIASVKVAPGLVLINNDTSRNFEPDVATPVTVTVTTLRRLADGDLVLA